MDEKDLIRRILDGDEEARTTLYRTHVKRLVPIGVYLLGHQDPEIEDVVQETFLIAFEKLATFEPRASLYTWMAHICIHRCYKRLNRRSQALLPLAEDLDRWTDRLSMKKHQEADREEEKQKRLTLVRQAVAGLGDNCREIITLRDFDGLSYAEIAGRMKIQMGTVMSRLARCREALKKVVMSEWETAPDYAAGRDGGGRGAGFKPNLGVESEDP